MWSYVRRSKVCLYIEKIQLYIDHSLIGTNTCGLMERPSRNQFKYRHLNTLIISWHGYKASLMMKVYSLLVLVCTFIFFNVLIILLDVPFPKNFRDVVKSIFKRLFRVYAHIYYSHFHKIVSLGNKKNNWSKPLLFLTQQFRRGSTLKHML